MTDTQENHLSMYIKVQSFLDTNSATLAAITQIATLKTTLDTLIDNITTVAGLVSDDTSGFAIDKANKRSELIGIMLKVSSATATYFASIGSPQGFKQADYTPSELQGARDSDLYTLAKRLFNISDPVKANLTAFLSGPADVADLDEKKEAFFDVIQAPQEAKGAKSAAVIDLEKLFDNGAEHLQVLDIYMLPFRYTNLNLHNQYLSARAIDNNTGGGGTASTTLRIKGYVKNSASTLPVVNAKVEFIVPMEPAAEQFTDVNGFYDFKFTGLTPGFNVSATLKVSNAPGFNDLERPFNGTVGNTYNEDFDLIPV